MTNDHKLIQNLKTKKWELYDLNRDPREKNNLFNAKRKLRRTLKAQLSQFTDRPRRALGDGKLEEETVEILKSLGYLD